MTERIRWEPDGPDGFTGYAGTGEARLFEVWQTPCDGGGYAIGEWLLTTQLPVIRNHTPHSRNPDELKAEAERWLEEFISSLGAIFPADDDDLFDGVLDEESFRAQFDPGCYLRYTDRDAGWPGERDYARKYLTPGEVYQIAWSDIGQSKTTLGLVDVEGAFNSVLFEPADDQSPAPRAAGTETTDA